MTKTTKRVGRFSPPPIVKANMRPLMIRREGAAGQPDIIITRITHACVLIQCGDTAILTDPWFSQKPLYHHGESLPFDVEGLPDLTVVLSSMTHYDHCDLDNLARYRDLSVPFVAIAGSDQAKLAQRAGFLDVREVAGWGSVQIGAVTLHAVEANDYGPRTFRYEQAYVIEMAGRFVLFCAHALKDAALARVKARFPKVDIALLGVNGLRIKPLLGRQMSMDPPEAARICAELSVQVAVPIHYAFNGGWFSSTFLLSHKGTPEQFSEAVRSLSPGTTVVTLCPGQPLRVAG
jgi:L-ascorbate metabolism protein UlaG (beta-lactamase superfamily)